MRDEIILGRRLLICQVEIPFRAIYFLRPVFLS
jgi:hypothetical protein